jgi:GntR family transcriptional regulator, arabinose operon transcriptional repressor
MDGESLGLGIMTTTLEKSLTTKHARLTDALRRQIVAGELRPGDRLPSISEFRTRHGVTLSTIEKVLSTLEREGMVERFHGKGTFVTHTGTHTGQRAATKCLGFIARKQGTPAWGLYWVQFMEGLQEGAHAGGYDVLLINPTLSTAWHDKVDGAIFHEMAPEDYAQATLPPVCVNVVSVVPGLTSIVADEFGGAQQAVRHLVSLGHRRIAYLVDDSFWQTQMRLTGYRAALAESGIEALPQWVRVCKETGRKPFTQWGREQMTEWLASDWNALGCTALLCHNDEVAMGVMEALKEQGLRIPEDLSLVGYDGTILCETAQPRLTSIKVPLREMGLRAAVLLIEQIEAGKPDAVSLSLPTTLQLRGSTGRLAHSNF